MTIALRAHSRVFGTSMPSMPTHQSGDFLFAAVANDAASAAATLPATWINLFNVVNNSIGLTFAYKIAQSSFELSGTWTNADHISISSWYGGQNSTIYPTYLATNGATSTAINYPAQAGQTFRTNSEDNVIIGYLHNRNSSNNLTQAVGALADLFIDTDGANYQIAFKYQTGRTTLWASTNMGAVATSAAWRTVMIMLTEQTAHGVASAVADPLEHLLIG